MKDCICYTQSRTYIACRVSCEELGGSRRAVDRIVAVNIHMLSAFHCAFVSLRLGAFAVKYFFGSGRIFKKKHLPAVYF